jgi:hypothetical protein
MKNGFIADGREQMEAAHANLIAAKVRASYAEQLADAGLVRRFFLNLRISREIRRELD